jgi:hypothetical protein
MWCWTDGSELLKFARRSGCDWVLFDGARVRFVLWV